MPEIYNYHTNPEKLASDFPIKWELNKERLPRLRHNLRNLFDEKNGSVRGAITENGELLLGDDSLFNQMEISRTAFFKIIVRRKALGHTNALSSADELEALATDRDLNKINNLLCTNFDEDETHKFLTQILNRARKTVFALVEKYNF